MLEKLSRHVASICAAEDSAQIDAALALAVRDLNFVSYNLTCGKQSTQDFMTDPDLTSWTTPDLEAYDRDRWGHRDPLLQRLAGPGRAHFWRGTDWLGTPYHDYSEYVLAVGIGGGITIPLASSPGRFSAMTLLTPTPGISSDQMAAAQILANVAQSRLALTGLLHAGTKSSAAALRTLSHRQKEILHWAAMGKSNAEIAIILGQTKRGVDYHISEITRKLGVTSRVQAIVIYAREQT